MGYIFEWDSKKAETNARKHGVTFDEACTAFGDPLALLMPDPDHSFGEERYVVLGMSDQPRSPTIAGGVFCQATAAHPPDLSEAGHAA